MPLVEIPYDRDAAVTYAHIWAYRRNPRYYDYEMLGGDCTNYASQCLYHGTGVMNPTPVFGWYYWDANEKAPAWTGVEYFYRFIVREEEDTGPFGIETDLSALRPGDFVQLELGEGRFSHTPVVVDTGRKATLWNTLVAAHSGDTDYRPLGTYDFRRLRCLHILGTRKWEDP